MRKTAIIIGGTGLTGSFLLKELLASDIYERVISFTRTGTKIQHPKLVEHVIDFEKADSIEALIEGNDMFCCLGSTIKKAGSQQAFEKIDLTYPLLFAKTVAKNGIKHFLFISSLGANANSANFYLKTKGKCEEGLRTMPFQTISIFRPALLLGRRAEFRFGERLAELLFKGISKLLTGPLKKYKPIKSEKVARAMFNAAQSNTIGFNIYESDKIAEL